ncbi:hypothetical protein BRADI_5g04860v3 [Brachypodium distachyon]|uniref:RRM domain-containing protein n=1 Tax=Brachypodium distachyon TaxID=15368 RepID=I1IWL8_BRADI|nr:hypothetical protein BRADI_5g04860v3 [Brachypodium distachyon]
MGQGADADEQLRRRLRRVFAAEERSFRMDRLSPAAAALRSAVADVLPRFLGSYSDDTLAEYIVILVCNGKHQYQARDDLEAFLGDDSAKFVAWLWGYLSKKAVALADDSIAKNGLSNESWNRNDKKNFKATSTQPGDAHIVKSEVSASPQEHNGLQKLDSTNGQNVAQRRISSTVVVSPKRLVGDKSYWEGQLQKKDRSATGDRSFSMLKSGLAAMSEHALVQEELHNEHLGRSASTGRWPVSVGTDGGEVTESMKRRRNVWDRLGKPAIEDQGLARETETMLVGNRIDKKPKLIVAEHEQKGCVNLSTEGDLFDKANSRMFSSSNAEFDKAHEHRESNRSRLIGRLDFGNVKRNYDQTRDVINQKSSSPLPVKSVPSKSLNEFTSDAKSSPAAVSESACHASNKSSKGHVPASNKLSQLTMRINSGTDVLQSQQISSPAQSKSGSSVREDGGNKPVKDMLDVKLKLKQMELDMLKLRSKQAQINNGKQGAPPSGPNSNLEDDADSRTVLVTNVHFAATKEALSTHFMKCGRVLKNIVLTDANTGHPKGAAFVTFADKESIGRAISLSGTSFYSRVLTVVRKAEAPPGFLVSVQQTGMPQPWNSPPFQKGASPKRLSSYHLQWKREQSVMENSAANCPNN